MRVLTYNVHRCTGVDGRISPERISDVIAAIEPDVACLQELNLQRAGKAGGDQARTIAERLHMRHVFFPTIERDSDHYGDAILCKREFQIRKAATFPPVPFPIPNERRGAIWIETVVDGIRWQVLGTHLGLGRSERRLQSRHLIHEWVQPALPGPLALCGDLNSRSTSTVHELFAAKLVDVHRQAGVKHPRTFPAQFPFICLDYIFVSPGVDVCAAAVLRSPLAKIASDHLPVFATLRAPSVGLPGT